MTTIQSSDKSTTLGSTPAPVVVGAAAVSLDPRTFTSWQDAFQYPIPTVQKFEKQIRNYGNENRDKLRSLVSASYRQLLGTADQIVTMNGEMGRLDGQLATIKDLCLIERAQKVNQNWGKCFAKEPRDLALSAQLSILQACPFVIYRLLKSNSILLASKVYVLACLLRKSLSDRTDCPPFVNGSIQKSLNLARNKLCRRVNIRLANPDVEISEIVNILLAYSLVTISTPWDAYIHFHKVRRDAVLQMLAPDEGEGESHGKRKDNDLPLKAFKLWIKTIRQSHSYFPSSMLQGFESLSSMPLVDDPQLRSLRQLRFDLHLDFVSPEIRNLSPLVHLSLLTEARCRAKLAEWIGETQKAVVAALEFNLTVSESTSPSLDGLVSLRSKVIREWLRESTLLLYRPDSDERLPIQQRAMLESLRRTFQNVISSAIAAKIRNISTFLGEIDSLISTPSTLLQEVPVLWDNQITSFPLRNGDHAFKLAVLKRVLGRNDGLDRLASILSSWFEDLDAIKLIIDSMGSTNSWANEFESKTLDLNDQSLTGKKLHDELAGVDPDHLMEGLNTQLNETADLIQKHMDVLIQKVAQSISDQQENCLYQGVFMIRIIRVIQAANFRSNEVNSKIELDVVSSRSSRTAASIPQILPLDAPLPIYKVIVPRLVWSYVNEFERSLRRTRNASVSSTRRRKYVTPDLWEPHGDLLIPTMPSLVTFGLVKGVCEVMVDAGTDLWTADGRETVRRVLRQQVVMAVSRVIVDNGEKNSNQPSTDADMEGDIDISRSEGERMMMVVLLFDLYYLRRAFSISPPAELSSDGSIDDLLKIVSEKAGLTELYNVGVVNIQARAEAYWTRTGVLFGVLQD